MMINPTARRLSSLQTFTNKYILPALWPFVCGFSLKVLPEVWDYSSLFGLIMIGFWSGSSYGIYWNALKLKRVRVDYQNLYVSNYFKEISIPLSEILDVRQTRWANPICIQLRSPSEFGDKILFMPTGRLTPLGKHPVIAKLRELASVNVHPHMMD